METMEDKDDEDVTEENVEFIAEKDVCDGVPLVRGELFRWWVRGVFELCSSLM